jgi:hypothetical protein
MLNNPQFCKLGQHILPVDSILSIDLSNPRPAGTSGGTNVRVWLHSSSTPAFTYPGAYPGAAPQQPNLPAATPAYYDFSGNEAETIRRWAANMATNGGLLTILGLKEISAGAGVSSQTAQESPQKRAARTRKRQIAKAATAGGTTA